VAVVRVEHLEEEVLLVQIPYFQLLPLLGVVVDMLNQQGKDWQEVQGEEVGHQMGAQAVLEILRQHPHHKEITAVDALEFLVQEPVVVVLAVLVLMFRAFKPAVMAVQAQIIQLQGHR
jgi:hypothetical protein